MPANWRLKDARPFPWRGHSLWKDCILATACGWEKGFTVTGALGSLDDIARKRADWEDSAVADRYAIRSPGFATNNSFGTVAAGGSRLSFRRTDLGQQWYTNFGVSCALLFQPNADQTGNETLVHFRGSPYGATNPGWSVQIIAGSLYQAEVCDGVAEATAVSTTAESSATRRVDLIVFTYDRANLRLFLNGRLEATTAATLTVGNPTNQDFKLYGLSSTGSNIVNGSILMCSAWRRALSRGDINQLYSDPFTMWRLSDDDDGQPVPQTFLAAF